MKKFIQSEKYISVLLILSTIYLLVFNIVKYDPLNGYDAEAHHSYVDFFSMYLPDELKLPTVKDTREFFNPPLPYIFPSIIQVICRNVVSSNDVMRACQPVYGLYTQIFQAVLYLISIYFYLKIFKKIRNDKKLLDFCLLIFISILIVNYKTFSMIRGEPYIIFFNSIILHRFYKLCSNSFRYTNKDIFIFGLLIGFLALSRQWAFLLFPAYFLFTFFIEKRKEKITYLKFLIYSFLIGFFISSWFYFGLFFEYGSFTAFNKEPVTFSFTNQPLSFYLPFGNETSYIFSKPIRPYFSNQFLPILYSDLWGDYWGYFSFTSRYLDIGRDQLIIGDYLGRVNILSLFTSMIIITFCFLTHKYHKSNYFIRYVSYAIISSFVGYLIFFILFPTSSGDTIKATYIIQAFHLMVFLASIYLNNLKEKNKKIYFTILTILIIIYTHNYQTYLSHFPINFLT